MIGRAERCVFCGQSPDRVRIPRQDHQIVEHLGRMQIHDSRRRTQRLGTILHDRRLLRSLTDIAIDSAGFLRPFLSEPLESDHRVGGMGSYG